MRARYAAARVHRRRRRPSSTWQLVKQSGADQKQRDLVRVHENTRKNLEQEISAFKGEAHKQRKAIFLLEKEGEKYAAEAEEVGAKYAQAREEQIMSPVSLSKFCSHSERTLRCRRLRR